MFKELGSVFDKESVKLHVYSCVSDKCRHDR